MVRFDPQTFSRVRTSVVFAPNFSPSTRALRAGALVAGPRRMCEPCTPGALLEAIRGLRVADPDLGFKPLLAKLREQQPDLGAATKEVRVALKVRR